MKICLSNEVLNSIDTNSLNGKIPTYYNEYFHKPSGIEHYRLLMYISSLYNNIHISDIGTHAGASALAFSTNQNNFVYSLDIENVRQIDNIKNVKFDIGNFIQDRTIFNNIIQSKIILLDIDHMYVNEAFFYNKLIEMNWKGLLFCDDIHVGPEMEYFWSQVTLPKLEITKYGHCSGTGVIVMDDTEFEFL